MAFKKRVSTVAPWWLSDTTKALQQRWWYSSTTSLDYCWCAMNKPPYYDFKLPCVADSSSQKTQPHAIPEDIFFSNIISPPLCFQPLLLNSGSLKLHDGLYFQKEGKTVKIEGLERRGGRERTNVSDTSVTYFELMRKKTLNCKEKKGSYKMFCTPG